MRPSQKRIKTVNALWYRKWISYWEWECHFQTCSIGHPPHSLASPVELRLRVGPHALSEKKELREQGVKKSVLLSVRLERSKGEEAWGK
jgi:hypothetical protein